MRSIIGRRACLTVLALAALVGTEVRAQWQYDPKQLPLLPEYCRYTPVYVEAVPGAGNPAQIERWQGVMGRDNFRHMHHYCWGLEHTNRAKFSATSPKERRSALSASIPEFDYVIARAKPDFALLPEIMTRKGENLLRLGRTAEGLAELYRALERKSDYWPPYAAVSDHFRDTGDTGKAREWLERGLAASPDSNALRRRLAALDAAARRGQAASK